MDLDTLRSCHLEAVHGFSDPAFAFYMSSFRIGGDAVPPFRAVEAAFAMSTHPHPLVRYAAGWAAIEAGTLSRRDAARSNWTMDDRNTALDVGGMIWRDIDDGEWARFVRPNDPYQEASILSLGLRQRVAQAYLPSLRLAARYLGGEQLTAADAYGELDESKRNLLSVARSLQTEPRRPRRYHDSVRGVAGELATAWLLQPEFMCPGPIDETTPLPQYVVAPASVRQDHHSNPRQRADLLAYSLRSRGKKTPVQVSGTAEHETDLLTIMTSRDLKLPPRGQLRLLARICRHEAGKPDHQDPELLAFSAQLTNAMMRYKYKGDNWPQ
ncbi:MAG TPA: hypothetical protein VLH84_04970 [Patescibacteria group bacterium]|nr:hypothetical protein [Patescibacteria group bacterium]